EKPTAGKRILVYFKVTNKFRKMAGLTDVTELKTRFASLVDEPVELFPDEDDFHIEQESEREVELANEEIPQNLESKEVISPENV
ncbi:MAG: hypothetical protein KAH30_01370, partial [Caldisericia bacterium]|nr:hypothetical protein [Caldisericia bacterium]